MHEVSTIKDVTVNYLKNIKYSGLFEAELKKDSRSGDFNLIEINARSWWQNHLPTICGINLVMMAYLDAIGKKVTYQDKYKTGVRWIHFINDIFSLICILKNRNIKFSEWYQSYKNIQDYAFFDAQDLGPWFIHPLIVGPIYLKSLIQKFYNSSII